MAAYQRAAERRVSLQAELTQQRQSGRTCMVEVGIHGREPHLPPRFIRALRKVDAWRVNPQQSDPLAALLADRRPIERLRARGKLAEAAAMEAAVEQLAAHMASWSARVQEDRRARRLWGEKPLWIAPKETSLADVQWMLAVYLLQAEVLDWSPTLSRFVAGYMGQFRYAVTAEERALLPEHLQLDRGGPGFAHLLHTYAQPEDARALRRFIARTLHGRQASEARKREDQRHLLVPMDAEDAVAIQTEKGHSQPDPESEVLAPRADDGPANYLIDEVVRMLRAEAAEGEWVPSRDTLYDWGNRGWFSWARDLHGRKTLDTAGLERVRALIQAKRAQLAIRHRGRTAGMSQEAIKKAHQRGRLDAIVARREERQRSVTPERVDAVDGEVSLEEVCLWIEGQLTNPALDPGERAELLDQLAELRRRLAPPPREGL
jgi:hypothetical protein